MNDLYFGGLSNNSSSLTTEVCNSVSSCSVRRERMYGLTHADLKNRLNRKIWATPVSQSIDINICGPSHLAFVVLYTQTFNLAGSVLNSCDCSIER